MDWRVGDHVLVPVIRGMPGTQHVKYVYGLIAQQQATFNQNVYTLAARRTRTLDGIQYLVYKEGFRCHYGMLVYIPCFIIIC
jgi:hypothetical protein